MVCIPTEALTTQWHCVGGHQRSQILQEALGCLDVWILAITEVHCSEKDYGLGCVMDFSTLGSQGNHCKSIMIFLASIKAGQVLSSANRKQGYLTLLDESG